MSETTETQKKLAEARAEWAEATTRLGTARDNARSPAVLAVEALRKADRDLHRTRRALWRAIGCATGMIEPERDADDRDTGDWEPTPKARELVAAAAGCPNIDCIDDALAPNNGQEKAALRVATHIWAERYVDRRCASDAAFQALCRRIEEVRQQLDTALTALPPKLLSVDDAEDIAARAEKTVHYYAAIAALGGTEAEAKKNAQKIRAKLREVANGDLTVEVK